MNTTDYIFFQFASIFFLNVDDGPEAFGEATPDAYLPYERIIPTYGENLAIGMSHMVRFRS